MKALLAKGPVCDSIIAWLAGSMVARRSVRAVVWMAAVAWCLPSSACQWFLHGVGDRVLNWLREVRPCWWLPTGGAQRIGCVDCCLDCSWGLACRPKKFYAGRSTSEDQNSECMAVVG